MSFEFDLPVYLERIDYRGETAATSKTLQAIVLQHVMAIPFENLNPLLRLPVQLDAESLFAKMVVGRRGGYCFEQNLLLKHALDAIGFCTTGLSARPLWQQPVKSITPRDHMVLLVEAEEEAYLVDVGFGGPTPTGVLRLAAHVIQNTPHEPVRLSTFADGYLVQTQIRDEWVTLYRFDMAEQFLPDYEIYSWYLTHFPQSIFLQQLFAARAFEGGRYVLRNNEFGEHRLGSETVRRSITTPDELRSVLEEAFLITLPDSPDLMPLLDKFCGQAT
jgi:N-hydroxyarylamine O-acetyltransferase